MITSNKSDMVELLKENKMVNTHTRNLQVMMTEVYCCLNKINPPFLWNQFEINHNKYQNRKGIQIIPPCTNTVTYGINSFTFRGSILWNYLPKNIKESASLKIFKSRIKEWKGHKCLCTICK